MRRWSGGVLLKQWYYPKLWTVSIAELFVRPGEASCLVMNGPAGEKNPLCGEYVELVDGHKHTFIYAHVRDWVPGTNTPVMTGYVVLEDAPDGGTQMHWGARHWSEETAKQYQAMGFEAGWNAAADQLDALALTL